MIKFREKRRKVNTLKAPEVQVRHTADQAVGFDQAFLLCETRQNGGKWNTRFWLRRRRRRKRKKTIATHYYNMRRKKITHYVHGPNRNNRFSME